MPDEAFQTFDADGNVIGLASRSRVHREGLWHRAVNVLLFRSDGRLLIQRRQWTKDVCPGAWDLSVAEHLKPRETYEEAAIRGLREESGIEHVLLEPVGTVTRARLNLAEKGLKDFEFQQSFRGDFDGEVIPAVAEVSEVAAVSLEELSAAFEERAEDFTPWFRESALRLGFCRGRPEPSGPP